MIVYVQVCPQIFTVRMVKVTCQLAYSSALSSNWCLSLFCALYSWGGVAILATCKFTEVNTRMLGHVMGGVLEGGCDDGRVPCSS